VNLERASRPERVAERTSEQATARRTRSTKRGRGSGRPQAIWKTHRASSSGAATLWRSFRSWKDCRSGEPRRREEYPPAEPPPPSLSLSSFFREKDRRDRRDEPPNDAASDVLHQKDQSSSSSSLLPPNPSTSPGGIPIATMNVFRATLRRTEATEKDRATRSHDK